jgi:hypothetical protein
MFTVVEIRGREIRRRNFAVLAAVAALIPSSGDTEGHACGRCHRRCRESVAESGAAYARVVSSDACLVAALSEARCVRDSLPASGCRGLAGRATCVPARGLKAYARSSSEA